MIPIGIYWNSCRKNPKINTGIRKKKCVHGRNWLGVFEASVGGNVRKSNTAKKLLAFEIT